MDKIIRKIRQCVDYQSLYAMEGDFNRIGLTVQTTANNRMALCRIKNGKPVANHIIDDYVFIGSLNTSTNEISENAATKIIDWVLNNASKKATLKNTARAWRNGLRMYENTIAIMNEDIDFASYIMNE
jgi:hypothetical protein